MTKMLIDRAVVEQALHVATAAGHPVALIAALRASLADQQEPGFWGRVSARQASRIKQLEATGQQALEFIRTMNQQGWMLADYEDDMERTVAGLEAALAEPETCTWQQDGDSDSGVYGTSCGSYFHLEDGTPEDNKMKWCCYCGKKLAQSLITEDEDE